MGTGPRGMAATAGIRAWPAPATARERTGMTSKTVEHDTAEQDHYGAAEGSFDHPIGTQGLRDCLLQLQREADMRGYALTAHLLAVAGDAILEEEMAHGTTRPH